MEEAFTVADGASQELQAIRERLAAVDDPLSLLAGIFAFAPVGFQIYRADGTSVLTNAAFRELFGSEPPPEYNVLRDEIAEREGVLGLIHRAFAGETVRLPPVWYDPRELRQVRIEQANRVAIEATFFPLRQPATGVVTYVAIIFKDVTAEITAREQAEAERDRLAFAQAAGRIGTWEWNIQTGDVSWTPQCEALYGLAPGGFGGRYESWRQAVHPDDRPHAEQQVQAAAADGTELNTAFRVVWPDGSVHHLVARARVVRDAEGRPWRMIGVNRDVTDLEEALDALRAAVQARDEFLSIAAHELRTPVTAIKGIGDLLARSHARGTMEPARLERHLRQLGDAADRLAVLTTDLLDVSRLRTGHLELRLRPLDLAAFAREAVDRFRESLPEEQSHEIVVQDGGPLFVAGDADRLDQVVSNLLSNAAKYSPAREPIHVSVRRVETEAILEVRDAGIGLPPGAAELIFHPFGRAPNATAHHIPGMGLGLYIARQFVERHGGRLEAESAGTGAGATFRVRLPAIDPPA